MENRPLLQCDELKMQSLEAQDTMNKTIIDEKSQFCFKNISLKQVDTINAHLYNKKKIATHTHSVTIRLVPVYNVVMALA